MSQKRSMLLVILLLGVILVMSAALAISRGYERATFFKIGFQPAPIIESNQELLSNAKSPSMSKAQSLSMESNAKSTEPLSTPKAEVKSPPTPKAEAKPTPKAEAKSPQMPKATAKSPQMPKAEESIQTPKAKADESLPMPKANLLNDSVLLMRSMKTKGFPMLFSYMEKKRDVIMNDTYKWKAVEDWQKAHTSRAPYVEINSWGLPFWNKWPADFTKRYGPMVLASGMNENFGMFGIALFLGQREIMFTLSWMNSTEDMLELQRNGQNKDKDLYKPMRDLFDSPNVLAFFTTQHHFIHHPKLIAVPLGLKSGAGHVLRKMLDAGVPDLISASRKHLMYSAMPAGTYTGPVRPIAYACLKKKFGDDFHVPPTRTNLTEHLKLCGRSKYVLAWSGDGVDTYRMAEALWMGAVGIELAGVGLESAYEHLPVLWIQDYADLTPELLEKEYPRFLQQAHTYQYERLTEEWWHETLAELQTTKDSKNFQRKFPKNLEVSQGGFRVLQRDFININTSCPWGPYESLPQLPEYFYTHLKHDEASEKYRWPGNANEGG